MKIKDCITKEGWIQGRFTEYKEKGVVAHCLMGWIHAKYNDVGSIELHLRASNIIRIVKEYIGSPNIVEWNDSPKRTYEDVKRLVDECDI